MKKQIRNLTMALAGVILAAPGLVRASVSDKVVLPQTSLEKSVRHELVMLPYFNIFDDLNFQVNVGHVTLSGQVTRRGVFTSPHAGASFSASAGSGFSPVALT